MPKIPKVVLDKSPPLPGLVLRNRGKVRDTYDLPGYDDLMLVVATDRVSIFDHVLPGQVYQKGQVLTALNHFWTKKVINHICEHDMVAAGAVIDQYLPEEHRHNPELQKRATVVRRFAQPEEEDIVRLYITGSGWKSYQKDGTICGHKLAPGLTDGDRLPSPLYTPTTKAAEGHDEHITADSVVAKRGFQRERSALQVAGAISSFAEKRGIILADTKFEFSGNVLVDEKGTPDSSRFWLKKDWEKAHAKGKLPSSLDKQFVRNWGIPLGIDKRNPLVEADVEAVHSLIVPENVLGGTTCIYRYLLWLLTGLTLEEYQAKEMGIAVEKPKRKVLMVLGSESDKDQASVGFYLLRAQGATELNIVSCHRNPAELRELVDYIIAGNWDVAVAGAGMAAALPGVLKALLCAKGRSDIPVIGVACKGATEEADLAARLSIEQLPEAPVEMDENGRAYFGPNGFNHACEAALNNEFLPKGMSSKEAKLHLSA